MHIPWCRTDICSCKLSANVSLVLDNPLRESHFFAVLAVLHLCLLRYFPSTNLVDCADNCYTSLFFYFSSFSMFFQSRISKSVICSFSSFLCPFLLWWWWWWWWWRWWIVFVVWLTDKRCFALFPAGTIVRDPHHRESLTCHKQDLNLCRTWVQA